MPNVDKFVESAVGLSQWSLLEPGIGILANNIATLRPLLRKLSARANISGFGGSGASGPKNEKMSLALISNAPKTMTSELESGVPLTASDTQADLSVEQKVQASA